MKARLARARTWLDKSVLALSRGWVAGYLLWVAHGVTEDYHDLPLIVDVLVGVAVVSLAIPLGLFRRRKPKAPLVRDDDGSTFRSAITAQQMLLVQEVKDPDSNRQFGAMMELWESIYGRPPDYSRPMVDLIDEVSVALNEMMS